MRDNPKYLIDGISIPRLAIGFVFTWIASLSGHTIPLLLLGATFPDVSAVTPAIHYAMDLFFVVGVIAMSRAAPSSIRGHYFRQWAVYSLVTTMLTETLFRGAFMNGYCTSAIAYTLVANIPNILVMSSLCAMAVAVAPRAHLAWQKFVVGAIIAAVGMFAANPAFAALLRPLLKSMSGLAPTGAWCALPYGPNVLVPAYLTFLEPALACVAAALLMWDHLPRGRFARIAMFALVILAVRRQLVTATLYAIVAKGPFAKLFVSMGQFSLEALLLGICSIVALDWAIIGPASPPRNAEIPPASTP